MKRKKEWARKFLVLALTAAMTLQGPASALASDEPVTEQQSGEIQTELLQSGAANTGEPTAEGQTQLNADTMDADTAQNQPTADNSTAQDQSTTGDGTVQNQPTADDGTGEDQSMTGESETQQSESEETKSETLETGAPEEQESSEAQKSSEARESTEEQESSEVQKSTGTQESTETEPAETQNTPDLTLPSDEPDGDAAGTESTTEASTDKTESETTPTETSAPEQFGTTEEGTPVSVADSGNEPGIETIAIIYDLQEGLWETMPTNLGTVTPKEEAQYQYTAILSDDLMIQKPDVDPVREGYAFKFWAKSNVAEEQTDFFADGAVKYDESATTLYAVWEEKLQNDIAEINADSSIRLMASDDVTVTYDLQKTEKRLPKAWEETEMSETPKDSRQYKKVYSDGQIIKPSVNPESPSSTFLFWSTNQDGSDGDFFGKEESVNIKDSSITLYAIWKLTEKKLTLNLNGGSFQEELLDEILQGIITGDGVNAVITKREDPYEIQWTADNEKGACTLTLPIPRKNNCLFKQWEHHDNDGKVDGEYKGGAPIANFASTTRTLKAAWISPTETYKPTVIIHVQGGKLDDERYTSSDKEGKQYKRKYTVNMGGKDRDLPAITREEFGKEYKFLGYYTEKTGGIRIETVFDAMGCIKFEYNEDNNAQEGSLELYARWQAVGQLRYWLDDKDILKPDASKGEVLEYRTGASWISGSSEIIEESESVVKKEKPNDGKYSGPYYIDNTTLYSDNSNNVYSDHISFNVPPGIPQRWGYTFLYWYNTSKLKDQEIHPGAANVPFKYSGCWAEIVENDQSGRDFQTMHAKWEEKTAEIKYQVADGQESRGTVSNSSVETVKAVTWIVNGTGDGFTGATATANKGYKFAGWTVSVSSERALDTEDRKESSNKIDSTIIQKYKVDNGEYRHYYDGTVTFIANFEPDFSDVKAKGFEVVYDGKAHDGKIQVEGLLAGDTVAYYIKDTKEKLAEHTITAEKTTDALDTERLKNVKDTGTSQKVEIKVTRAGVTHTTDVDAIIKPRPVDLESGDETKVYDGTPLINHGTIQEEKAKTSGSEVINERGWIGEEGAEYSFTGSQTVVGSSPNTFTFDAKEGTDLDNYKLFPKFGTLTVTPRPDGDRYHITVQANSGEKKYNGTEQGVTGFESLTFVLEDNGQTYTVEGLTASGKGLLAGVYDVLVSGTAIVRDANGNDVTSQFVVEPKPGKLMITDDAAPELVVAKTHEGKNFKAGDVVTFTVSVTNIYDEEKDITLTEQEGVTFEAGTSGASVSGDGKSATFAKVPKGGKVTITAKYTVTAEDVQKGSYTNTVTAKFSGADRTFTGSDTLNTDPPQTETDPPSTPSQTEAGQPSTPPQTEAEQPGAPSQTEAEQPGTPTQTEAGQPGTPSQTEAGQPGTPAQTEAGQPGTTPQTETEKAKTGVKLTVTKSIVNESDRHLIGLDGATFYVALFLDAELTQLVGDIRELDFDLDTAVASVTYKNLKPGTYYVSEVNARGKAVKTGQYGGGAYAAKYADNVQKVTIAKGDRAVEFAFENWFLELPDEQYYKDLGLPESKTESEPETEAGTEPETQADGTVPGDTTAAKTGDGTPIGQMLLLLAVSGALLILTEKRRRRSRM